MTNPLQPLIKTIADGGHLPRPDMEQCFDIILDGDASPVQMAAFVTPLKFRGETPDDIAAGSSILPPRWEIIDRFDWRTSTVANSPRCPNLACSRALSQEGCHNNPPPPPTTANHWSLQNPPPHFVGGHLTAMEKIGVLAAKMSFFPRPPPPPTTENHC